MKRRIHGKFLDHQQVSQADQNSHYLERPFVSFAVGTLVVLALWVWLLACAGPAAGEPQVALDKTPVVALPALETPAPWLTLDWTLPAKGLLP